MTVVAALGFGDMPPAAFAGAFNMVVDGGLVALNIKDEFLEEGGFASFIAGWSTTARWRSSAAAATATACPSRARSCTTSPSWR